MEDEKFLRWKQENHINGVRDVENWLNEGIGDERFFMFLHEDAESFELMTRYLDEMPVTRESAEEIIEAIRGYDYLITDDLMELLKEKFQDLLTEEEREEFLNTE